MIFFNDFLLLTIVVILHKALHIHVTDSTFKLLERKSYEVQERPKMTINGNVSITTYFILNKKDRAGKVIPRPFQTVLEEMKREDTEKAKMKQTSSLKGTNAGAPAAATVKENGSHLAPPTLVVPQVPPVPMSEPPVATVAPLPSVEVPPPTVASVPIAPPVLPVSVKIPIEEANGDSSTKVHSTTDPSLKTFDVITDRPTMFNRASRSKTCSLL